EPRSFSCARLRFRPSVPVKAVLTHRIPAATFSRALRSRSSAKLKIRIISRAKTSIELISSLLRSSAARSFHSTAPTARPYWRRRAPALSPLNARAGGSAFKTGLLGRGCIGLGKATRVQLAAQPVKDNNAARQDGRPVGQRQRPRQIVGGQQRRAPSATRLG